MAMQKPSFLVVSTLLLAGGVTLLPAAHGAGVAAYPEEGAAPQSSRTLYDTEPECKLVYVNGEWVWVCYD